MCKLFILILIFIFIFILIQFKPIESFDIYQIQHRDECLSSDMKRDSCDNSSTKWTVNDFNIISATSNPDQCLKDPNHQCAVLDSTDSGQYIQTNGKVLNRDGKWISVSNALEDQLYKLSLLTLK